MKLVLLEGSILSENYADQVCCSRVIQYISEHQIDCIAIVNLNSQLKQRWKDFKMNCPFPVTFFDQQDILFHFETNVIILSQQEIKMNDQQINAIPGTAVLIETTPYLNWQYLVIDIMNDIKFSRYHKQPSLHGRSLLVLIQVSSDGKRVFN